MDLLNPSSPLVKPGTRQRGDNGCRTPWPDLQEDATIIYDAVKRKLDLILRHLCTFHI